MNEFELIDRLTRELPSTPVVVVGPGDDCALLDLGVPGRHVVFKTDAVVAGIHFTDEAPAEAVGHKALGRVLSDFAAMAATPAAALITIVLPRDYDVAWVERLYAGLRALAQRWGVAIAGGETSTCPERTVISVAAVGTVEAGRAVLRSGARPGDALFVTGELGGSLAGHHLEFEPRLDQSGWLTHHFELHAMIDLSDGLAGDLRHILNRSAVGAELLKDAIPVSRAAKLRSRMGISTKAPLLAALTDGEDFELLFTVAGRDAVPLLDAWRVQFPGIRLSCIGKITQEPGLRLRDRKSVREIAEHGYVHLA